MKGHIMYQRLYGLILMSSFIFLTGVPLTSSTMLSKSGESKHPCLVPNLVGRQSLTIMVDSNFVSENMTIQETSTILSQQIDLTTPSQITGLKPQNTVYTSTIMSNGIPVFKTDYKTISYSNTTSPPLETMTVPKFLKTSISETATFIADILSTSAAVALPTKNTSTGTTTNSMKITKSPSSENTVTTKRAGAIFETFYPTTATNFLYTSGFTKNSIVPKTSAIGSPLANMKTASLCSSIEPTSKSTPSWHKHISTGIRALPISTASQEFLASTVAGTVPWSTVKQTSTHIGTASAFPPTSVLISKAAPVDTVFPRNQKASTLAMTDKKISFTVHSMTLPSKPIETTSELRTVETELTSTNFQDVSSPRMEDTISISMPKEASSMALSFRTSSSLTRAQSVQTNIDTETTHTSLVPGITLAPAADESMLSPTVTGSEYTKNTSTDGENMFPFISTRSAFTSRASESGPTTISDEGAHLFTSEINWTSRPDQTLLMSIFHGNTSNTEHSSTTADVNMPPEASIESEATTTTDAIINTDTVIDRYTTALSNLTSPCLANFSIVSRTTSVNKLPEFKLTTLLLRTTPRSTVAGNELISTSKETVFPPVDIISTLADTELDFSTESASEITQTEVKNTIAFGETTIPVPESATTQRFNASVTRKETTSHYLKGRSTIEATTEVSPFATMQEATDESIQMVTASVIVSPFPDLEKSTSPLDNKTATTEVRGRCLSPKSVKTTSETSYNGSTEIFNSTHTYTAEWTSETPPEGNPTPYPTSGSTKAFPEPLVASTIRILETSFATIPTERTAMSSSTGMLPPQPTTTHSLATPVPIIHMYSLPVNASAVTSMVMSEETKVTMSEPSALARASSTSAFSDVSPLSSAILTTASVPPTDQTASTTSDNVTPIVISFLTETTVSSLRPTSPLATKAETTFLSTSADRVTSSTPTLACSKYLPDNISVVTSTHMISTMSIPVATQSTSRVEDASTHALSFPNTFNGSGDVVSLITATTENYAIDETRPSANKLTTSDGHISQFSTRLANILVPTLSVTHISTLTSDKEQIITSLGKTLGTMEVTEISPSNNPFISESQNSSSLEMTDTEFAETTKMSSHQTHSPSEIPLVTPPDGISASSPTPGHTQTVPTTWISSNTDVHISEMSTSLGKTAFPSKALTITTFLSPDKESISALSIYTCRTEKMTVRTTSVTQPFSYHQNTSFVDAISSRTTRISNPININTTFSHLLSPRTQPEVTSVASPISESTQTSPESLSFSITGLSSANFTIISTDRVTTALSAPSVTTALLGKTSMATSIPLYQMSSLPVTAFTSKRVSDTPTILMTKYSKITHADCLKRHSIATSGRGSEMSSMSVHDSAFSPPTVSPDNSTTVGSFSTLSSSITPRTTITIQTSTLDVTPVTYAGSTSKSTMVSSAFTTSEMTEMSSQITPTSFSSPTETTYPSVKTIPTTIMAGVVTPFVGTTDSFLLSSENTEAMSSIPKTTFSPFLSTSPQSFQGDKATTLGILTGITNTSLSTVSSGRVTIFTNTYSRTAAPKSAISSISADSLPTPLNIQVSQYLTSFKSTPRPTQSIKATTFFSSKTKKMTSLSENTSSTELTKGATSVNTPVSYHPWTPSSATLLSFKTFLFSPHSTKAEFSTPKTYLPPTSHMVEFPVLGTRTTSSNTQPLLMTSWNIPIVKDSQFPIFTTTHVPTPKKMETETPYLVPGSLSTFTASKTGLVSGNVMAISSISTSGILPTLGMSESPSLSISSRTIPTTLVDIKQTFVSFYNVGMSFSVFDEEPAIPITSVVNELAENWLNSIFQDSEFALANVAIQIKSRDTSKEEKTMDQTLREGQEMATISHALYSCVCQVIIKANSSLAPTELISRIKSKIHGNLMHGNFTQDQLTLLVKSEHVAVKKLEPGKCKAEETTSKYKGTYKWLLTNPTDTAQTRCIKNKAGNATRICSISMDTGKSQWEKPKFKQCQLLRDLPDKIVDLANITISDENADDVAKHILNLINESPSLDEEETTIIVSKLSDISQCDEISMKLTKIILQIIDAVLGKQNNSVSDLHEVSNEILRIINHAGHKMEFLGRTANLTVASLALAVLQVDHTFEGMIFSIRSYEEGTDPEIYLSEVPLERVLASIYLPKSLKERIPLSNLQTILFNFFGQTSLFKIKNVTNTLTTYVVSASISGISIQNLADPVVITLQHLEGNQNYDQVHCAFWDFVKNNGLGGWNSSGCKVKETNINYTICHCDHLTHFGVLMDLSRSAVDAVNEQILVLITYTGCGISSIFLGVAMVTYIAFHKLRKDHPSKILINLCAALLMLNLVFLFNSWSSSFQTEGLCITAAVALHYFLLVSLTWMGLEAVHMYFALVKVFNIYIPNYILKFCLVGWGIPAIMVTIILSVKKDLYGTLNTTSPFCWIKDNSLFYISVVAYFCLIFLINFSMFCTVLAQLNSIKSQSQKTRQKMILYDLKSTTSLTFLLGLTWGFAFFAWGPVRILFLYLFAIFNTLQGFLIFVFHCVMKESVREQWRTHLCCRRLQLDNFSDGSSRYELNVGYKQERLKKTFKHKLLTPSLKSTTSSSTFKSLGSSQGTPSQISFPSDNYDEDSYCCSPLSCDVVPNCVRRILPVEIKMNSIHKQRFLQ